MTPANDRQHRSILRGIARQAMFERGLLPDFPPQALAELDGINGPAIRTEESTRDLRHLIWCSIDSDDSRDLDQVTGASDKGTWVRLLQPPVEGRLVSGFQGLDVGHRLRVQLIRTDVERGYIDFKLS
jgi:hypothetical protein